VAAQHRTAVNVPSQIQTLHRIRLRHIEIRVQLCQRLNWDGAALGVAE
jgi:hypothetical protein